MNSENPLIPAVSVALLRGDTVLLVRRGRPPGMGLYAFPGGRAEPGETPEQAARRELAEETGLAAGPLRAEADIVIEPSEPDSSVRFRLRVFSAPHAGGEPVSGDDAAEARFFTLAQMRGLPLAGSVLEIAQRLLGGGPAD